MGNLATFNFLNLQQESPSRGHLESFHPRQRVEGSSGQNQPIEDVEISPRDNPSIVTSKQGKIGHSTGSKTSR